MDVIIKKLIKLSCLLLFFLSSTSFATDDVPFDKDGRLVLFNGRVGPGRLTIRSDFTLIIKKKFLKLFRLNMEHPHFSKTCNNKVVSFEYSSKLSSDSTKTSFISRLCGQVFGVFMISNVFVLYELINKK